MRELWAYSYRVAPPPAPPELGALRRLLDHENATAFERARPWAAQLIVEPRSTQILVVTDTPSQHRPVNRRLESTLQRLPGAFRVSAPVAIHGPARAN